MDHVKWDDDTHYEEILSKISKDNLWEYTRNIVSYQRETGSEGERRAVDYIRAVTSLEGKMTKLIEATSEITGSMKVMIEQMPQICGSIAREIVKEMKS